jgi:hypothetical protein
MAESRAHNGACRTADGEASDAADDLSPKHGWRFNTVCA